MFVIDTKELFLQDIPDHLKTQGMCYIAVHMDSDSGREKFIIR